MGRDGRLTPVPDLLAAAARQDRGGVAEPGNRDGLGELRLDVRHK